MGNSDDIEIRPKGFRNIDDFVKRCQEISLRREISMSGDHLKLLYDMAGVNPPGNPDGYAKIKISGPELDFLLGKIVNVNPDIYYV